MQLTAAFRARNLMFLQPTTLQTKLGHKIKNEAKGGFKGG